MSTVVARPKLLCSLLLAGFALAVPARAATGQSDVVLAVPGLSDTVLTASTGLTFRDIPFRTVVRQQYDYSCGSAALATLLRFHYGLDVNEATVFQAMYAVGDQAAIRKVGFSLLDMKKYLRAIGYGSDGYKLSLDELAKENVPAITVITVGTYKHFAVVKGINAHEVLLGDPALGLRRVSRDDFSKIWTGIVFILHAPQLSAPIYNALRDWRPWAPSPVAAQIDQGAMANAAVPITTIIQVTQFQPLN